MKGLVSASWAKLQPVLRSSQSVVVLKTVGHSRKACTHYLGVSKPRRYLALIVLSSLTLATAVVADDDKTYPGAMCLPLSNEDHLIRDGDGRVFNERKDREANVICPVIKDRNDAENPEFARISVIGSVRCTFRSRNYLGQGTTEISPTAVIPGPGNISLQQYAPGEDTIPAGVENGYYYFDCHIAARSEDLNVGQGGLSGIITYKVSEKESFL
jgi:hypothetical protein